MQDTLGAGTTSEKELCLENSFQNRQPSTQYWPMLPVLKRVFDTKFFLGAASRPKVVKCFPASYTRFKIQYDSNEGTMCLSALHSYLIGFDVHGLKTHYLFTLWVIGDWRSMLGWRLVVSIVLTCVTTL